MYDKHYSKLIDSELWLVLCGDKASFAEQTGPLCFAVGCAVLYIKIYDYDISYTKLTFDCVRKLLEDVLSLESGCHKFRKFSM